MPWILFILSLLPSSARAGCQPSVVPQTLDPSIAFTMASLGEAVAEKGDRLVSCRDTIERQKNRIPGWIEIADTDVKAMQKRENDWVSELLNRKLPKNADRAEVCGFDRDLAEAEEYYRRFAESGENEESYESRGDALIQSLAQLKLATLIARAEGEIIRAPAAARQLRDCRSEAALRAPTVDGNAEPEQIEAAEEAKNLCLENAQAPPDLWTALDILERYPEGQAAGLHCALGEKNRPAITASLQRLDELQKKGEKFERDLESYRDKNLARRPKLLAALSQRRKKLKGSDCQAWEDTESRRVQKSLRWLRSKDETYGTGFVLSGPEGVSELVTARHLSISDETKAPQGLQVLSTLEENPMRWRNRLRLPFPVRPGDFNYGQDLAKRKLGHTDSAFTAVPDGTVLPAGAKVRIHGYAASRDFDYTSHACTVLGVGRNPISTPLAASYVLHCPGAEAHIGGTSGGPVTDEKGEVIGVISAHSPLPNIVIVQPVSRGPDGENHFGFQKPFLSDHCLENPYGYDEKPCQVIPGLTYEKSVP